MSLKQNILKDNYSVFLAEEFQYEINANVYPPKLIILPYVICISILHEMYVAMVTVDVSKAGEGQLEIMVNNGNLPNTVELERPSVYRITFTPTSAGKQYVDINFNGESLPGT